MATFPTVWHDVTVVDCTNTGIFVTHQDYALAMWVPNVDVIDEFDGIKTEVKALDDKGTLVCEGRNAEAAGWM